MIEQIAQYRAVWDIRGNHGVVDLELRSGEKVRLEVDSAAELAAVCGVLKVSNKAWFDVRDDRTSIFSEWTPPGA